MNGRDPSLTVPTLLSLGRGIGSPSFRLERTPSLEEDPPFELRASGLRVGGGHMRGVGAVRGNGPPLACALAVESAVVERSMLSPLGLERRLIVGGVGVVERVVVSPAAPVVFLEWIASNDVEVGIGWRIPLGRARWQVGEGGLVVAANELRALYLLSRPATDFSVDSLAAAESTEFGDGDADHDLLVAARFDMRAGDRVLIAMAEVAGGADEARILRVMGRPHVAVPARRAAALRTLRSTLAVDVPGDPVSEALDWARLSLAAERFKGGEIERGEDVSERWLRVALAGLAVGDASAARSVIRGGVGGAGGGGDGGTVPATGSAAVEAMAGDARWLLLVARYLAWTGDLALVKEKWARVVRRADRASGQVSAASGAGLDLLRRALVELTVAAEEAGDQGLASRVRAAVGDGEREAGDGEREAVPEIRWTAPVASDGSGSGVFRGSDVGLEAAALVEAVVEGVLRVEPDAPRGRLVLRPRLPPAWSRCVVRGLTMGDAVVEVEYRADGGAHDWTVRQRRGGAPISLIFEPELVGARLATARVDGAAAALDAVAAGGRVRVPVQLVLDHERRVEVEIEGRDD